MRETINYDTFFEYCEANKKDNYLDTFVMCYLLNCDDVPKYPSFEFHQLMVETYKRRVADAKLLGRIFGFLPECIRFIDRMMDAGVRVFKIEGRARGPEYVYTVVKCYKEAIASVSLLIEMTERMNAASLCRR